MSAFDSNLVGLAVALGIGLLIGAERERRKGEGPTRSSAGIRTFAVVSLAGAVSLVIGGELLLAITTIGVIALAALAYWRSSDDDPGLTTEVTLVLTALLGGLSVRQPELAAGIAAVVAGLLAARAPLHRFVRLVLSEAEARDALIFAGATLVVLPLFPNRAMGPYQALNPHFVWIIVILVMAIGAAGHVAVRILGVRFGLPITGLASGFISGIATIGSMGARARRAPGVLAAAVAGAVLSNVATIIQMGAVLAVTDLSTFRALLLPLICAGATAAIYGAVFTFLAFRQQTEAEPRGEGAFSLPAALGFATILCVILVGSAALREWFGEAGAIAAAGAGGFVDTHSPAVSIAMLVRSGRLDVVDAAVPILAGFSTNTISKVIVASATGNAAFARRVIPGLVLVGLAAWVGAQVDLAGLF